LEGDIKSDRKGKKKAAASQGSGETVLKLNSLGTQTSLADDAVENPPRSNGSSFRLKWTDDYPNNDDISTKRYHRFIFGPHPVVLDEFLLISRYDINNKEVMISLKAPLHYHDHIRQLLLAIYFCRRKWLQVLRLASEGRTYAEAKLHGLGIWLRYLDHARDLIFDEIRASTPTNNIWSPHFRLHTLEEWIIKHQLSLHAKEIPSSQLSLFNPSNIPIVIPQEKEMDFLCRPGTLDSYEQNPPLEAEPDFLNYSGAGLGGSYWKRETEQSIKDQYHKCDDFLGQQWPGIQKTGAWGSSGHPPSFLSEDAEIALLETQAVVPITGSIWGLPRRNEENDDALGEMEQYIDYSGNEGEWDVDVE
jgi:hypothetical protein